jgi:hypothetical protein
MNPDLKTPYSYQYNLTVEKEVLGMGLSGSYISTLSRKNVWGRNLRQPVADTRPYAEKLAQMPFPYAFSVNWNENGGSHSYHSGIIKAERRMKGGLYYQAHLTYAKSMGDDWGGVEDAYNRGSARSQGGLIPRWRGVVIGLYELPFGRGRKFGASMPSVVNHVLGNWLIAGTWVAQTGRYFHPTFSGSDPSNTNVFGGRPDRIADGNLPDDQRTLERWFDTSAFVAPPAGIGRFGNSGVYILQGPGLNVFHFGTQKDVVFTERMRLKLEMTSTNFFKHPNFNNPAATIGTSTYVRILSTVGTVVNLDLQLTDRFIF